MSSSSSSSSGKKKALTPVIVTENDSFPEPKRHNTIQWKTDKNTVYELDPIVDFEDNEKEDDDIIEVFSDLEARALEEFAKSKTTTTSSSSSSSSSSRSSLTSFSARNPHFENSHLNKRPRPEPVPTKSPYFNKKDGVDKEKLVIIKEVMSGKNCFITGSGGTGKSYLITKLRNQIKDDGKYLYITATSGIAAIPISGTTLHSWAGIGYASKYEPKIVESFRRKTHGDKAFARWAKADVLIIDEISMLAPGIFEMLNDIGKIVRNSMLPFGGIQVVAFGDFCQLPPVTKEKQSPSQVFAFQSKIWNEVFPPEQIFYLQNIYRQKDPSFKEMLQRTRMGYEAMTGEDSSLLLRCAASHDSNDSSDVVRLFSTNEEADNYNKNKLDAIDEPLAVFQSTDIGEEGYQEFLQTLKSSCLAPEELFLKKGATVMLLKNLDLYGKLANGTVGTVIGFVMAERSWFGDRSYTFYDSSIQTLLDLPHGAPNTYTMNNMIRPVVKFGKHVCIISDACWKMELGSVTVASRTQLPLRLSWAITVHKAQGMSLKRTHVCMNRFFAHGQGYTSLSRSGSREGLTICHYSRSAIKAHPAAVKFYQDLEAASRK